MVGKSNTFPLRNHRFFLILDLIKFIHALQQHHSTKLAQMDQMHSKAIKQLEMQLLHQQNHLDGEN
jgi:hypothetical protein